MPYERLEREALFVPVTAELTYSLYLFVAHAYRGTSLALVLPRIYTFGADAGVTSTRQRGKWKPHAMPTILTPLEYL